MYKRKENDSMLPIIQTIDKTGLHTNNLYSEIFLKERKIYLFDELNNNVSAEIIMQLEYLDNNGKGDITLYINSLGGSVVAGFSIIDFMDKCKNDVVTICTGCSASMAAVILSCGTKGKRFITPYAEVMIHQPLGSVNGQASDIERAAKHISKTKELIINLLSERTGQSKKHIAADCDRDTYLTADEAVKYGIVDRMM